ncbi:MAG TPA: hypothetical protein VJM12_01490 [Pyrinomonadaceae bacterium]|nr:hypothetical protein [Pyrinomonadaceae bacterium]
MTVKSKTAGSDRTKPPKKPYRQPQLSSYGQIRDITKNMGGTVGKNDGGGGVDKTGF